MSKTIVQEYGPIYGEPVNGTVMGRPNGSVFVPIANTIEITLDENDRYVYYYSTYRLQFCKSDGTPATVGALMVAESQDLANNMQLQIYSDEELTTLAGYRDIVAGDFNAQPLTIFYATAGIADGTPLYLRAQLLNNGVPVATSNVITVEVVNP